MSKRPNFVLFVTDQHRADHLGCHGHPILRTPNIDDIAARRRLRQLLRRQTGLHAQPRQSHDLPHDYSCPQAVRTALPE